MNSRTQIPCFTTGFKAKQCDPFNQGPGFQSKGFCLFISTLHHSSFQNLFTMTILEGRMILIMVLINRQKRCDWNPGPWLNGPHCFALNSVVKQGIWVLELMQVANVNVLLLFPYISRFQNGLNGLPVIFSSHCVIKNVKYAWSPLLTIFVICVHYENRNFNFVHPVFPE